MQKSSHRDTQGLFYMWIAHTVCCMRWETNTEQETHSNYSFVTQSLIWIKVIAIVFWFASCNIGNNKKFLKQSKTHLHVFRLRHILKPHVISAARMSYDTTCSLIRDSKLPTDIFFYLVSDSEVLSSNPKCF